MQAQKELNESTSNFFKENLSYPEPENRHQKRVNAKEQRAIDKRMEKMVGARAEGRHNLLDQRI